MTARPPSYAATCKHCGRVIVAAERFTNAELARLREHAGRCFSDDAPADDSGAGEVLRHFAVEREP